MSNYFTLTFSDAAKALQTKRGSRKYYGRMEARPDGAPARLGPREAGFIAARDSLFMASAGLDGWPYVQHRGGPPGFLKLLDDRTLGFADFTGNKQYITTGNLATDARVSLLLLDYAMPTRLKIMGRARTLDAAAAPDVIARLADPAYRGAPGQNAQPPNIERAFVIEVAAFDWNCPQFITPRFTAAEIAGGLAG